MADLDEREDLSDGNAAPRLPSPGGGFDEDDAFWYQGEDPNKNKPRQEPLWVTQNENASF